MRKKAQQLYVNITDEQPVFSDGKGRYRKKDLISDEDFSTEAMLDVPEIRHDEEVPKQQQKQEEEAQTISHAEMIEEVENVQTEEPTVLNTSKEKEKEVKDQEEVFFESTAAKEMKHEVSDFEPTTRNERYSANKKGTALIRFQVPKAGQPAGEVIKPKRVGHIVSKYQLENLEEYQKEQEERKKRIQDQLEAQEETQFNKGIPIKGSEVAKKRRIPVKTASATKLDAIKRVEKNKTKQEASNNPLVSKDYAIRFYAKYGRLPLES